MFEKIIPLTTTKRQQSKIAKLQKKFSIESQDSLGTLLFLIYDFFIAENQEAYQACLKIMEDIGFPEKGQALQWPFIEPAYWLKYYLADASEKTRIHDYLLSLEKGRPDHMITKRLNNILSDETIQYAKDSYEDKDNTPLDKYEAGLALLQDELMQLTYKPINDPTRLNQTEEVENIISELKEQFQKINKFI